MANVVDPWSLKDVDPMDIDFPIFVELYCEWMGWQASHPQYRMAEWLQDTDHEKFRVLQAYRGASKSTVTSLYSPWRLSRDPMWTVMLVSARSPLVSRNSRYVRSIIEQFPLCVNWDMKPEDPDLWRTTEFSVNRPQALINPSCSVTSLESFMTGRRAKMLLMDDVEVEENTNTEEQRELLHKRVRSLSMINSNHLFVGTPHSEETVYRHLEENDNNYHFFRIPVIGEYINNVYVDNGILANPDVELDGQYQNEEWIEEKKNSLTDGEYKANFLLIPSNVAQSILDLELIHIYGQGSDRAGGLSIETFDNRLRKHFEAERHMDVDPQYWVDGKKIRDIVAAWDPSSAIEGRDQSVLAIVAITVEGDFYIMHIEILSEVKPGETFEVQCKEVLNVLHLFGLNKVYVETNFNPSISGELKAEAKKKKRRISIKHVHATGGKGKRKSKVPVSKVSRIAKVWEPAIKTGLWIHKKAWKKENTNLQQQLREFPSSKKDDIMDAVAWGMYVLSVPSAGGEDDFDPEDEDKPKFGHRKIAKGRRINNFDPIKRKQLIQKRQEFD